MPKPFMKLDNIRKNAGNNIQSTIDYMARINDYDDRDDAVSKQVYYLPELYKSTTKNDISGIKEFYEDFEKYSRRDRRLALSVIFDLPVSNERRSLTEIDKKIYPKIVKNFVDKLNQNYSVITTEEDKKITLRNDKIVEGTYKKIEKLYIPSFYAIHNLEKEGDKNHPHCHMLISTIGYVKDDLMNCNCTKENIIRSGINNEHLGKTSFYYDIYDYFSEAANEELKKLPQDKIDRYYINLRNAEILREERKRFGEIASSFANMDVPQLSYLENLMLNNTMYELEEEYKEIDKKLHEVHETSRNYSMLLGVAESDSELLKLIAARNKLGEKFLNEVESKIYKIETPIIERKTNSYGGAKIPTNYNGHRITSEIIKGIDARDVIKPKVYTPEKGVIPFSYDYGSMEEYANKIKEKADNFIENDRNIEILNRMLSKFTNEYFSAVKSYNGYDEDYLSKNMKKNYIDEIYTQNSTVEVIEDKRAIDVKLKRRTETIARMDYMIFAALEKRNKGNMIKNCFETGKFEGEEKKWTLDDYIELNSNLTYELRKGESITTNYQQTLKNLELLKNQKRELEKQYNSAKTSSEKTAISLQIQVAVNTIDRIDNAIIKFERYEKPKLTEQFSTVSSKSIRMSPTTIARYEKEIANFKNSLTNFRKIENEKSGIISFANAFARIKREYQRVGKPSIF